MKHLLTIAVTLIASQAYAQSYYAPSCGMGWCKRHPLVRYETPQVKPATKTEVEPSPDIVIREALRLAQPLPGEVLYDLGCGDGRVLISGSQQYDLAGVGVEINSATAAIARRKVAAAECNNIRIVAGDATKYKLNKADIVYLYLYPDVIEKLHPTLSAARVVISYEHVIPQLPTEQIAFRDGGKWHTLYVYRRD